MADSRTRFFFSPRRIVSGCGCVDRLAAELARLGCERVLLVSDPGVRAAGIVDRVGGCLASAGMPFSVFEGVKPNPTVENVSHGVEALEGTSGAPGVVAVGGGSVMDAAKMIAAIATNGGSAADYDGVDRITRRMLPLVAVNTTAGTGSDVTRWAVISDPERQVKMAIGDENIVPDVAIDDPFLTTGMPQQITAGTGMDALTHALEGLVGTNATPMTDALALEAARLIGHNLRAAYENGQNIAARESMMYAQVMAGLAFENAGVGNVHAMAHQLSAVYDLPHGLSNAVLLPYVIEFNSQTCAAKYARASEVLGAADRDLSKQDAARLLARAIVDLNRSMEIPLSVTECGAHEDDLEILVAKTMDDGAMTTNPRTTTVPEMRELWTRAFQGGLSCLTGAGV